MGSLSSISFVAKAAKMGARSYFEIPSIIKPYLDHADTYIVTLQRAGSLGRLA